MKKGTVLLAVILTAAVCLVGCRPQNPSKPTETKTLTVLAAASLCDVVDRQIEGFEAKYPEYEVQVSYASSGTLQTQIEQGVPADVFFSANRKQMDALEEKGLIVSKTRKNLLGNQLVLIAPSDSNTSVQSFEELAKDEVTQVAIGEPESVPVGQYAKEAFEFLGIWGQVEHKAIYGSDARAVLTWVETGEASFGLVYATDAAVANVRILAVAPEGSVRPIVYPAAVLAESTESEGANLFLDYWQTEEARNTFETLGFTALS